MHTTPRARSFSAPNWGSEMYFHKVLSLSVIGHACLLLALLMTPIAAAPLGHELYRTSRFLSLELPPPAVDRGSVRTRAGGASAGESGIFGEPALVPEDAAPSRWGNREPTPKVAAEASVIGSGLLAVLNGPGSAAASRVLGSGGLSAAVGEAMGGLRGERPGRAMGSGGMASRGGGRGGGGQSIGIGGLGNGPGSGPGSPGAVSLVGRQSFKPTPRRSVLSKGCLSQSQVTRTLERLQNRARYCFEMALGRDPNLAGKVTTVFEVGATGTVNWVRVSESTLPTVESCLSRVVKRAAFPPCRGGGTAQITYPWVFKSGG